MFFGSINVFCSNFCFAILVEANNFHLIPNLLLEPAAFTNVDIVKIKYVDGYHMTKNSEGYAYHRSLHI